MAATGTRIEFRNVSKVFKSKEREVKAVDTTGAGDCFVGALASQLAGGKPLGDALAYANAAASICVQRMGAAPSMPTAQEVSAVLSTGRPGEGRDP
mgnify:CR=1 FL=1